MENSPHKFFADRPLTNPENDLFGYAPFAKNLANSIIEYKEKDALVMGLSGEWGSGKTSVLKFINFYLQQYPEKEQPIILEFNPWWFSGKENLAQTFLGQLKAVLPKSHPSLVKLGALLDKYAEGIGGFADAAGITQGHGKKAAKLVKKIFRLGPKDVPALKSEISKIITASEKRIVIIVDDIDRIETEELHQLFAVIKAVADFHNVIYLLAFDQNIVCRQIRQFSAVTGYEYLEKIIQVPFVLPHIDRPTLHNALFKRLDDIINGTPDYLFENDRWSSIFINGIDCLFNVPRDIIRFCNTLSITYPPVCCEVNCVDYIAIEAIRVFVPELYQYICNNTKYFIKYPFSSKSQKDLLQNVFKSTISEEILTPITNVIHKLFPYTHHYYSSSVSERKLLRISSYEVMKNYFSFSPVSEISNSNMQDWIDLSNDAKKFGNFLLQFKDNLVIKVHNLLDRLSDYIDSIPLENIKNVIYTFMDISDNLIESNDERKNFIYIPNDFLIRKNIYLLLQRLPKNSRFDILEMCITQADAIINQGWLLNSIQEEHDKGGFQIISIEENNKLIDAWLNKVEILKNNNKLLNVTRLANLLYLWNKWEKDSTKISDWTTLITRDDMNIFHFIESFICYSLQSLNGSTQIKKYINPEHMKIYIDINELEKRILELRNNKELPPNYEETAKLYLDGMENLNQGKNPDLIN